MNTSSEYNVAHDGDPTEADLAAAESLALIEAQRRRVGEQIEPDARLLYGVWGLALLIGEAAFFFATWQDSPIDIPRPVAGLTLFALLVSAMVISGVHISRRVAGVRGTSARQGTFYGWSWTIGFLSLAAIITGVARTGVEGETIGLMWAAGSGLVVGLLYMAGGAIWLDRTQFALGAWFAVVSGAGAVAGSPWIYLVLSVAGGGGMLAVAATLALRTRLRGS
ncbi:MAG: hypothetical protein ACR2J5_04025 [Geodermatophilaceae bacterium]